MVGNGCQDMFDVCFCGDFDYLFDELVVQFDVDELDEELVLKFYMWCVDLCGCMFVQCEYLKQILLYDVMFGIGLVGIGKIYFVVVCVVDVFECDQVKWIVLMCLVVEVGEWFGFLFGDFVQKVDLYLCLLYDVLYDLFGFDKMVKMFECQMIEIVLFVYMCGCMLNYVFIIFDEVQNMMFEQMKMFFMWIGFGLKVVVMGDMSQVDLLCGYKSGFVEVQQVFGGVCGIVFICFMSVDVVCYLFVVCIVEVYDEFYVQYQDG